MDEFTYIDEDISIFTGEAAKVRLAERTDLQFMTPGRGIERVTTERWQEAQRCESRHWLRDDRSVADDRNYDHLRWFGDYNSIRGERFASALEVGCGPFTNLRLIGRVAHIRSAVLLDPLIGDHRHHVNRSYNQNAIALAPLWNQYPRVFRRFPGTIRTLTAHSRFSIPVDELVASSMEEWDSKGRTFDLIVMVNVLEHCFDLDKALRQIERLLQPGGTIIFADRGYDPTEVEVKVSRVFDAAHPLRVTLAALEEFVAKYKALHKLVKLDPEGPFSNSSELYFIGTGIS